MNDDEILKVYVYHKQLRCNVEAITAGTNKRKSPINGFMV